MCIIRLFFAAAAATTLLFNTLDANEHYLLPEHNSNLIYALKQKISRAETITIISGELQSPLLGRSIEKAIANDRRFHLITADLNTAAYYAKYKNSIVKVPVSDRPMKNFSLTLLLIDESDICFSSLAFSEALLRTQIGEVICTTNREEIAFGKQIKAAFMERFEDYNR